MKHLLQHPRNSLPVILHMLEIKARYICSIALLFHKVTGKLYLSLAFVISGSDPYWNLNG